MLIALEGAGTLTERLAGGIVHAIRDGRLEAGSRLPAQRILAEEMEISRNVVLAAYERLRLEGYLEARRGAGTFVRSILPSEGFYTKPEPVQAGTPSTRRSKRALRIERSFELARPKWAPGARSLELDFRYGPPAFRDLPFETFCRLLGRRYRRASRRQLDYGESTGARPLREAISRHLASARGVRSSANQVIVTQGTQEAIRLAAQVLIDPGDRVVVEDPGYLAARQTLVAHGARVLRGRLDERGLVPEVLQTNAPLPRMVYVTPSHQFPTGVVMPENRRIALLERAARAKAFVFEDDYDGELHHHGRPVPSLQGLDGDGRVLYAGSFSKSLFPALRLGYLIVPNAHVAEFEAEKMLSGGGSNTPLELAVADFIDGGHLERHVRRTRVANRPRRQALVEAVKEALGTRAEVGGARVGHHAVLWLRDTPPEAAVSIRGGARALGVGVYPVAPFYAGNPPCAGFLLGFASLEPNEIREGIFRLAEAVTQALPGWMDWLG
jgi:GntR family transcriptional regulator/MocR family aminotransferase